MLYFIYNVLEIQLVITSPTSIRESVDSLCRDGMDVPIM